MTQKQFSEIRCVQYGFELSISASKSRVWRALTDQLSTWWLPTFHMLGEESEIYLEPRAGGRLYETNGKRELLWYNVALIDPDHLITLVGHCSPEYGGPSTSMLTVKLDEQSAQTILRVSDALYGRVSDGHVQSLESGWMQLFDEGLKRFAELSS